MVRVPAVVREGLQGGTRIDLYFLFFFTKRCNHSYNFCLSGSVNKFLIFCVAYFPWWIQKMTVILSHSHFLHVAFVSILIFQTFDRITFGTLTFPGTRWYVLIVRDPRMVRNQTIWEPLGWAWHSNLTKIPLIFSVSLFNLEGLELCLGGISPLKPPRGDGAGIATYFIASCVKRSMISLKNPLLVWDWTLVRIMWMSVHREKVSKDKQGFIERVFDCLGRDLRRLQLFFLSDAG